MSGFSFAKNPSSSSSSPLFYAFSSAPSSSSSSQYSTFSFSDPTSSAPPSSPSSFSSSSLSSSSSNPNLSSVPATSAPSFAFGVSSSSSAAAFGLGSSAPTGSSTASPLFGSVPSGSGSSTTSTFFGYSSGPTLTATSTLFGSSSVGSIGTSTLFGSSSNSVSTDTPTLFGSSFGSASNLYGSSSSTLFGSSSVSTATPTLFGLSSSSSGTPTLAFSSSSASTESSFPTLFGSSSSTTGSTSASSAPAFSLPTASSFSKETESSASATVTSSSTRTTSSQPQSTAAPLFGVPASTSAAATISSTGAAATQTSSSLVASSCGTTSSVSTSVSPAPKLPSEITGRTVEEIIKVWNSELQERTGKFRKQANAIAEWDSRILRNCEILLRLETEATRVVETQDNLERQLELIETHQHEVDKALQSMEEEDERLYKDERGVLLDDEAASTRDAMYEQVEVIERELEQMTEQIKSIIQTLNANQGGDLNAIDGMTPLDVVGQILNNQLSSLMWIDEKIPGFTESFETTKVFTSVDPEAASSQMPSLSLPASTPEASIPSIDVPSQDLPPLMTTNELREFKNAMKPMIRKPSVPVGDVLESVKQLVGNMTSPIKVQIDTGSAKSSLKLFGKTAFEIFEDKEMRVALELCCQVLLDKGDIIDTAKEELSNFLSSCDLNWFILDKVLADRKILEQDLNLAAQKRSQANATVTSFEDNAVRLEKIEVRKAELLRELEALDVEQNALEANQKILQADLHVLNTELAETPSKHKESISRQIFIASHSKSYNQFWDKFRLMVLGL